MTSIKFTDNSKEAIETKDIAIRRASEIIGIAGEKYAKALCPVGTVESTGKKGYRGGTLRNSITHEVGENKITIGSNVEYAPFVELGTGPYFTPPPEWEYFKEYTPTGEGHGYVQPRPFLRPAITNHINEYKNIVEEELKG